MKSDKITLSGKIDFEPEDKTKKHVKQSTWKCTAMVLISGDVCEYYSWFIKKRYGLVLIKPLRGGHVTFINDRKSDMFEDGIKLDVVKEKWNNKEIEVTLNLDPRSDSTHWWLDVNEEDRIQLQTIRSELGLGRPFFGMHMTLGYANEKNIEHSKYIHELLKNGFIK